jgi:hypothetical protein
VLAPASVLKAPSWMPKPVLPGLAGIAAAGREGGVAVRLDGVVVADPAADVPGRRVTAPPLAAAAAAQAVEGGAAAAALAREPAGVAASPGEARP